MSSKEMTKAEIQKWWNKYRLWKVLHYKIYRWKPLCEACIHSVWNNKEGEKKCPSIALGLKWDDARTEWVEEIGDARTDFVCIEWIKYV
jgi:hypothetical protein